jgi:hypothetical protein
MTTKRNDIIGAWRLESCEATDGEGGVAHPLGTSPTGILVYDASGVMSVAIMREGRSSFTASDILQGTIEERARAAEGYLSYAGRFVLDDDGVGIAHQIEVSLFPNWVGVTQRRRVMLDGDVLVLSTEPVVLGGKTRVARMRWRRYVPSR